MKIFEDNLVFVFFLFAFTMVSFFAQAGNEQMHIGKISFWEKFIEYSPQEFEEMVNQSLNLNDQVEATLYLGIRLMDIDDDRAYKLLEYVAAQNINLKARAEAQFLLASSYVQGKYVEVDYIRARELCEQLKNQSFDEYCQVWAKSILGIWYYKGVCGVEPDYVRACELFEQVFEKINSESFSCDAPFDELFCGGLIPLCLGEIYYLDCEGVECDNARARKLFEYVFDHATNDEMKSFARDYLMRMDSEDDYFTHLNAKNDCAAFNMTME